MPRARYCKAIKSCKKTIFQVQVCSTRNEFAAEFSKIHLKLNDGSYDMAAIYPNCLINCNFIFGFTHLPPALNDLENLAFGAYMADFPRKSYLQVCIIPLGCVVLIIYGRSG